MKVVSVVGARPQFIKLAAIARAMAGTEHEHVVVHTGQHYDDAMSDSFFRALAIPSPDHHLGVGSGSHGRQTGAMLAGMDRVLEAEGHIDWVLTYGDTNSTVAAALSAVKQHVPVAHLEAGLRSYNRAMPEEHNRVLTDHCSDLLLAPTNRAAKNLADEGLASRTIVVGDVMTDILFWTRDSAVNTAPKDATPALGRYVVATMHRAENTDDRTRLATMLDALSALNSDVVLLAHPRLRARARDFGLDLAVGRIHVCDPAPYPEMIRLVAGASGVVTDSGGLQKEAYLLGVPCTTIRAETEWVETLHDGWNVLCADPSLLAATVARDAPVAERSRPYGDGRSAQRVVDELAARITTNGAPKLRTD